MPGSHQTSSTYTVQHMSVQFPVLCKVHCHEFSWELTVCFLSSFSHRRIRPSCQWLTMCWLQTASTSVLTTTWHTLCSGWPTPALTSRRWVYWRGWDIQLTALLKSTLYSCINHKQVMNTYLVRNDKILGQTEVVSWLCLVMLAICIISTFRQMLLHRATTAPQQFQQNSNIRTSK